MESRHNGRLVLTRGARLVAQDLSNAVVMPITRLGTYNLSAYLNASLNPASRHMDYNELRQHIESVAGRKKSAPCGVTSRALAFCWPGGSEDRIDRAALEWFRRWRPERAGIVLPECSCATGRCLLCN